MEEFKQRQRAIWAAGDYATLADYISDVGELVVQRTGVRPGLRVLDVACGTGNAATAAARVGADTTGLDLVPELLEGGRAKAEAAGLEIEFVEGDAEELPFEDGSFDRVLSTFGHMFAPRHRRTADEMLRVCAEGGVIGICCWTPEGVAGEIFRASAAYMPAPPDFAQPPILWGSEEHVREMFGEAASEIDFERNVTTIDWESLESFADFFMDRFPMMVAARSMLGDRFAELRAEVVEIWRRKNEAGEGRFLLPQEYLLSVVRL